MLISDKEVQEELETETNLKIKTFIDNNHWIIPSFFE